MKIPNFIILVTTVITVMNFKKNHLPKIELYSLSFPLGFRISELINYDCYGVVTAKSIERIYEFFFFIIQISCQPIMGTKY